MHQGVLAGKFARRCRPQPIHGPDGIRCEHRPNVLQSVRERMTDATHRWHAIEHGQDVTV
jgi:hypothetical protein